MGLPGFLLNSSPYSSIVLTSSPFFGIVIVFQLIFLSFQSLPYFPMTDGCISGFLLIFRPQTITLLFFGQEWTLSYLQQTSHVLYLLGFSLATNKHSQISNDPSPQRLDIQALISLMIYLSGDSNS